MNLQALRSERYLIPISFACIYFIWGSTYLATAWALKSFPPFFMTSLRLITAGLILLSISYKHFKDTSSEQLRNAAFFGFLILGLGTGGSMWSILYLDTGIASLIVGCEPLVLVLLAWVLLGQKPSMIKMIGIALGMLGMYALVSQDRITTSPDAYKGLIAISISIVGWSLGALYVKGANVPSSKVLNTSIQMLSAGFVLMLVSIITQESVSSIPEKFTWTAFFCVLYLIFFGSIIAYSAFNYLLMQEDPRKVVTVTYVNPIIAVFLGWLLNGEVITMQVILAGVLLIMGVVFIIKD